LAGLDQLQARPFLPEFIKGVAQRTVFHGKTVATDAARELLTKTCELGDSFVQFPVCTGNAWENKSVGFLWAAAGMSSYLSITSLANSLMLDFRNLILLSFVYATSDAFAGDRIVDTKVTMRVADLAGAAAKLDRQLQAA
jgi:hypothetical protein